MTRAGINAPYNSEDQRPASPEHQVETCRRLALERGFVVLLAREYVPRYQTDPVAQAPDGRSSGEEDS